MIPIDTSGAKRWVLTKRSRTLKIIILRYFFINTDGILVYFSNRHDSREKGRCPLSNATYDRIVYCQSCIEVHFPNRRYNLIILHLHDSPQPEIDGMVALLESSIHSTVPDFSYFSGSLMGSLINSLPTVLEDDENLLPIDTDFYALSCPDETPRNDRYLLTCTHACLRRARLKYWCEVADTELLCFADPFSRSIVRRCSMVGAIISPFSRPYITCHRHIDQHYWCFPERQTRSRFCAEVHLPSVSSGPLVLHCHGGGAELTYQHLVAQLKTAAGIKETTELAGNVPRDFLTLRLIGRGGFAKVYLVRHNGTGVLYAMKVIEKKKTSSSPIQVEHTLSERQLLADLHHPFIVRLHYAFQTATNLHFILEYCSGGELFSHLRRKRTFSEIETIFYLSEVVLALSKIHESGVIYRDIKPENILLDSDGHIRLTDFGLAKRPLSESGQANTICGSIEYMAPEILLNQPYGKEVDWWSLGCLAYELTAGISPFYAENNRPLIAEKIKCGMFEYPSGQSHEMVIFISDLLCTNPSLRLGSGANGIFNIQNHPLFAKYSINWADVLAKRMVPPIVPETKTIMDTVNFDSNLTTVPIGTDSFSSVDTSAGNLFTGFSYNDQTATPGHRS